MAILFIAQALDDINLSSNKMLFYINQIPHKTMRGRDLYSLKSELDINAIMHFHQHNIRQAHQGDQSPSIHQQKK